MTSLLKNDFYRLKKEKAHLILFIVMLGYTTLIFLLMFAAQKILGVVSVEGAGIVFSITAFSSALSNVIVFTVLSGALTISGEFRNRTINLKVLGGHSRTRIFFSSLLSNLSITIFMILTDILLCVVLSFIFFGGFGGQSVEMLKAILVLGLNTISITIVAYFVSYALKSNLGIIINCLIIFLLTNIISTLDVFLSRNKVVDQIFSMLPYATIGRVTTALITGNVSGSLIANALAGSAIFAAAALVGGWLIFRQKELT